MKNTTERVEWAVAILIICCMVIAAIWLCERGQVGVARAMAASSLGYLGIPGKTERLKRMAAEHEIAALENLKQRFSLIEKAC